MQTEPTKATVPFFMSDDDDDDNNNNAYTDYGNYFIFV